MAMVGDVVVDRTMRCWSEWNRSGRAESDGLAEVYDVGVGITVVDPRSSGSGLSNWKSSLPYSTGTEPS